MRRARTVQGRRATAVGAVGLALGLVLGLAGCTQGDAPVPRPSAGWHQSHVVEPPAGWRVTARNVGIADESTSLLGPGGSGCLVSTWPVEPPRTSRPVSGRDVEVQGFEATFGDLDPDYGPYPRAVVWADASGRWFAVSCDVDQAGVLAVATGVHAGVRPMTLPFRLSGLPPGTRPTGLVESLDGDRARVAALLEVPHPGRPLTLEIANVTGDAYAKGPVEQRRFPAGEAELRPASQSICFRTRTDPVCLVGPGDEPATDWSTGARDTALQTAELLSPVADPADRSTWIDADAALPR